MPHGGYHEDPREHLEVHLIRREGGEWYSPGYQIPWGEYGVFDWLGGQPLVDMWNQTYLRISPFDGAPGWQIESWHPTLGPIRTVGPVQLPQAAIDAIEAAQAVEIDGPREPTEPVTHEDTSEAPPEGVAGNPPAAQAWGAALWDDREGRLW